MKTLRLPRASRPVAAGMSVTMVLGLVLGIAIIPDSTRLAAQPGVPYSFHGQKSGGGGIVCVDPSSGTITKTDPLFDSADCRQPLKIRRSLDHQYVLVTNMDESGPHLFVWSAAKPTSVEKITLRSAADEVRLVDNMAFLTLEDDAVAAVNLATSKTTQLQRLDKSVTPPANAPEDIAIAPDHQLAVVSFQKDGGGGKKKGNRLMVFTLPDLILRSDLPLPRNRPELHIEDNPKEQGPGPEVVNISLLTDTLSVTLDLYGAVGIVSWSKAKLGQVRAEDWTVLGTGATDKITGNSFPDRTMLFQLHGQDYLLICNAGEPGGSVLVDLERRQVIWRRPSPSGLESPVFVPSLGCAFSVCSGKTKRRHESQVIKQTNPRDSLYIFDFHSPDAIRDAPVAEVPLGGYTSQIALASVNPPLLLVAIGQDPDRSNTLITIDPVTHQIKDRHQIDGVVDRFDR